MTIPDPIPNALLGTNDGGDPFWLQSNDPQEVPHGSDGGPAFGSVPNLPVTTSNGPPTESDLQPLGDRMLSIHHDQLAGRFYLVLHYGDAIKTVEFI